MQDKIGARWEQILRGKGYALTGDEHFLRRFQASPYITTVLRYAHLEPGSLILEPGCGSGKFSLVLASLGHRVIALDYVNDVLQGVRATQERLGERWPGRLRGLCQGSLEHLPFPDNTFDLVMNEGVVEHWLDDRERLMALREMVRVTRPGGVVAVIVPNGAHPLIKIWESRLAGFSESPPMTYYNAEQLGTELAQVGLKDISTDGIYPWRSLTRIAPWNRLYLLSAALDHLIPLPRSIRQKLGINLVGLGLKPKEVMR
ncbi:MAG: class I SAM-dependent methyltransferase [Anaerolineae bacterium]|jgi:SAM-dependent methyltransferase